MCAGFALRQLIIGELDGIVRRSENRLCLKI